MTSIIKLCPLSGGLADSVEDAFAAHCYLLEVDQFTFLLDCGWDAKFSDNVIQELKKHVHKVRKAKIVYFTVNNNLINRQKFYSPAQIYFVCFYSLTY